MCNTRSKKNRMLELFYRAMCGENISVKKLAEEYGVSTKSISRDISEIKNFLSENRDLVGNTEFRYTSNSKSYYLELDSFLFNKELFAIIKMMIGCRAFNKMEIIDIITKLKRFTSPKDRSVLENFIRKEIYHYNEVHHDCKSVIDNLWQLIRCIDEKKEIKMCIRDSPRNVRLAEAPSYGIPINLYDTKSVGAESYRLLAEEVLSREEEE